MAREGLPYIAGVLAVAWISATISPLLSIALIVLACMIGFFFRDPKCIAPPSFDGLCSPANGKVMSIEPWQEHPEGKSGYIRISIYLSIFNVHVNRSPIAGTIKNITYTPGAFTSMTQARAFKVNENNLIELESAQGIIFFRQIAGLVARRIVCYPKLGDVISQCQKIGLIKFGSGMQLMFPRHLAPTVTVGQMVKLGSIIARPNQT